MSPLSRLRHALTSSRLWRAWTFLRHADLLVTNVKALGYETARQLTAHTPVPDLSGEPIRRGLISKPTTQHDMESPWFHHWCRELGVAPLYYRKLWEHAFALQVLHDHGMLCEGTRGLGFGCGEEPLASYFARRGMQVVVTDQAAEARTAEGWKSSQQHLGSLAQAWHPHLVDQERFDQCVTFRTADMNHLPAFSSDHDFCWSICAMEHLGSIEAGLAFVEESTRVLRPGGVAVHTTEFNLHAEGPTLASGPTVLFQRRHVEQLAMRLEARGCTLLGPDFFCGSGVLDRFFDLPPYFEALPGHEDAEALQARAHLKLSIAGFPVTCYGLVIVKG